MEEGNKSKLYIQITAGRGPAECCWVVAQVLKVLIKQCEELKLPTQVISRQQGTENGTLYSALLEVSGKEITRKLASWHGVIQWIGKSPFRKYHKRKNWFVGVAFFETKRHDKINRNELQFQTFRASGPGGQHRNKVETAVRVTHKATGVTASASESKSQHQNKQLALKKLEQVFEQTMLDQQRKLIDDQWHEHLSLERGNAVKVFEGKDFDLKK